MNRDNPVTGPERDARQVFHRLAGCWTHWGREHGYFDSEDDAQAFEDELSFMLANQMTAPNSPQWFNTGLHWAYGITGPPQGHRFCDPETGELKVSANAYEHPQPHACFIQSVSDDLVNEGGIMDLWVREARLFKYGSGTGSNFSQLRGEGEPLSGGGKSSGLMSFLKIGDRAAGAIKSGGTTRRAAKMVCLDLDHPDIEEFISWKAVEERKVAALVAGSRTNQRRLTTILAACFGDDGKADVNPKENHRLAREIRTARRRGVPDGSIQRVLQLAAQGIREYPVEEYDTDWDSAAYFTVSGQNANNSVRVPNAFFETLESGGDWPLIQRTDGKIAKTVSSTKLWDDVTMAAWECADPGLQYDDTINEWHTCPNSGRINASNPVLRVHVPRRHRVQPGLHQSGQVPPRGRHLRHRGFPPHRPAVDHGARNLGAHGLVPIEPHRRAQLSLPHPRSRFRQHRLAAHASRHPIRLRQGPRHLRRHHRHHDRRGLHHLGRDGLRARPLRGFRRQPRRHAAGHRQPPPRGLWRTGGDV